MATRKVRAADNLQKPASLTNSLALRMTPAPLFAAELKLRHVDRSNRVLVGGISRVSHVSCSLAHLPTEPEVII
jgi:hypothetical protein